MKLPTLRNPTPEEELLSALTRQEFLPGHRALVKQKLHRRRIRWDVVYETAARQGVAPLTWVNLANCPEFAERIPDHASRQFTRSTQNNILRKALFAERARGILDSSRGGRFRSC
jgi:hypothetical protein